MSVTDPTYPDEKTPEPLPQAEADITPVFLNQRKQKHREQLLQQAAKLYGQDFIGKLNTIRDPKERILFAAEAVFARNGFAGARTQEIADLAGVNKAMIHYYFETKDQLYHAILDQILFDLIRLTQQQLTDDIEPAELLKRFFLGYFDYVASHKHFSRISAMAMGSNDRYLIRIIKTFFKPLFDRGVAFIERGVRDGVFNKIDAKKLLVTIYAMTMAYFSDSEFIGMVLGHDPLSEKTLKEHKQFLLEMIFAVLIKEKKK